MSSKVYIEAIVRPIPRRRKNEGGEGILAVGKY